MPGDAAGLSLIRDVKELQRLARRHRNRNVSGAAIWDYQEFTTAGPNTLRYLPVNLSPDVELNGVGLREGVDYTWDYSTGVITLTAAFTTGDKLTVRYQTTGNLIVAAGTADVGFTGDPSGWAIVSNRAKAMSSAYSDAYLITPSTYNTVQVVIQSAAGVNNPEIAAAYNPASGDWAGIDVAGLCTLAIRTPAGNSFASLLGGGGPSFPSRWTVIYNSSGVLSVNYDTLVGGVWTLQASQVLNATGGQRAYLDGLQDVMIRSGQNTLFDDFSCGSITDSFNRADQTGLGTTDTGQNWNYNP